MKKSIKNSLIIVLLVASGSLLARGGHGGGHGGGHHGGHMGGHGMGGHGYHGGNWGHGGGYRGGYGYGGYGAGIAAGIGTAAVLGAAAANGPVYEDVVYDNGDQADYDDNQLNYDIDLGEEIIIAIPENRQGDRRQPISMDAVENRGTSIIQGPDKTFPDISDQPARWEQEVYNSPK
jgi:hypothetical protein